MATTESFALTTSGSLGRHSLGHRCKKNRLLQKTAFPTLLSLRWAIFGICLTCMLDFARGDLKPDLNTFRQQIQPLLQKYCVGCHGREHIEAKIRFDNIDPNILSGEHTGEWEDTREAFNSGEMPPEDELQPTDAERTVITQWLDAEFKKAKQYGNPNQRGSVRRLTRYELRYALEDLLQISVGDDVTALPEEGTSPETGLKNSSRLLMVSGPHLESYLNVVLSVINRMKRIVAFEPHAASVDIETLDTDPEVTFGSEGRKNKPPVGKVERVGKGVVVNQGGYIDLPIRSISKYMFQIFLSAKTEEDGKLQVSIGFTHSEVDPRQKTADLGIIEIEKSDDLRTYSLNSYPEMLPAEMTRALDRPFFIRITNRSSKGIYLETFDYKGNVNTELTSTLIPSGIAESEIADHMRQSIFAFMEKAFRRSPSESDIERYYGIYQTYRQTEDAITALLSTYKEILCSPGFFYLGLSRGLSEKEKQNYELAERLAIFLWCSVPDKQLLASASASELTTPSTLASHVDRMLNDKKSRRWVEAFTDQWLQTSKLFNVAVDKNYYPRFKESMKKLMRLETVESVNDVFRNGSSAIDLLNADHVFVNQELAAFYRIKGVQGADFRKVSVKDGDNRGGLLTQGTFLVGNSDGTNSHAILRGVWLAEVILNDPPPVPPKNVPPLDESIPGFEKLTLNEKLFAHRNHAACKNCHQKIDPWGIPFENFDASGAWRDKVLVVSKRRDQQGNSKKPVFEKDYVPIDRESTLPDQVNIDGVDELKEYLAQHRRRDFGKSLIERILAYALSRDVDYHDDDQVEQLVHRFEASNYSVPVIIRDIVQSEQFHRGY